MLYMMETKLNIQWSQFKKYLLDWGIKKHNKLEKYDVWIDIENTFRISVQYFYILISQIQNTDRDW